jgi:hypothetical protein
VKPKEKTKVAKVNFEFDTVEKTYSLTLDGKPITNVSCMQVYMDYPYDNDGDGDEDDKACITITTRTRDEEQGLCHYTQITASEKEVVVTEKPAEPINKEESKAAKTAKDIATFIHERTVMKQNHRLNHRGR